MKQKAVVTALSIVMGRYEEQKAAWGAWERAGDGFARIVLEMQASLDRDQVAGADLNQFREMLNWARDALRDAKIQARHWLQTSEATGQQALDLEQGEMAVCGSADTLPPPPCSYIGEDESEHAHSPRAAE